MGDRRSPDAPRGQQRQEYTDRTSGRGFDLVGAGVVREAKRDEKMGFEPASKFVQAPRAVYSVLGAAGPRAVAASVALPSLK